MIAEQQSKLNKLFSTMRHIKKIVKKTRRQNHRKMAEQNAKIDTLISLLATNAVSNSSTLSPVANTNEKESAAKSKGKNTPSTSRKDHNVPSLGKHNSTLGVKHVLPLITVSGPTDMELSPYSMG